jgi:hypothetical protein
MMEQIYKTNKFTISNLHKILLGLSIQRVKTWRGPKGKEKCIYNFVQKMSRVEGGDPGIDV